jgi:hypothetical protein
LTQELAQTIDLIKRIQIQSASVKLALLVGTNKTVMVRRLGMIPTKKIARGKDRRGRTLLPIKVCKGLKSKVYSLIVWYLPVIEHFAYDLQSKLKIKRAITKKFKFICMTCMNEKREKRLKLLNLITVESALVT